MVVFDDMIADMLSRKELDHIVPESFIRGRKLNMSFFITQSYFKVPKDVRLNTTNLFIMKIPNKRELQQILHNHSLDIDLKNLRIFTKMYCKTIFFFYY